jgi:hypothetical protein
MMAIQDVLTFHELELASVLSRMDTLAWRNKTA